MAKIVKCPSCGASDYEKTDETHYKCNFCESSFILEEKKRQTDINEFLRQFGRRSSVNSNITTPVNVKSIRAVMFGIVFFIMALGIGIAVFVNSTVNNAMNTTSAPGKAVQDDYWTSSSVNKFHVFTGSKGPVVWILINQSSKGLDSARYILQLVDPVKDKIIHEKIFKTMTWKEGFDFSNHLSEMVSYNDKVYFLSDASGLNVYDLYSGKRQSSSEEFAATFSELKTGIVSAKNKYYRDAIELMTNDGFKFNYLPKYNLLVSEEDFNDYRKVTALTGAFTLLGEPRLKLYYTYSKQDTLRNDLSISDYYLKQYLASGKANSKGERAYEADPEKVFFNVKYLFRNKNQIVFAFTEGVDKKSAAYIISYHKDDLTKEHWKITLKDLKNFEKTMSDDWYLRTHYSENELVIWYESAQKSAVGIELKTGKINWRYTLK